MEVQKELIDMLLEQAATIREEWNSVCDSVISDKPKFIKRTKDRMWFSYLETMAEILKAYCFTAVKYVEEDGTITLSLNEIDLIENGPDENSVRTAMGEAILEYSLEYYNNYSFYSKAPNRKKHIPYIFKALINDNSVELGQEIICQDGKN